MHRLELDIDPELRSDPRWQLIERITTSSSFQKSARIRDLLFYMAEKTLRGQKQDLTEHAIGSAVFGKPQDYSVVEDSSVRVQVRQLRLKIHEYFGGEGRNETLLVEIPKGAYTLAFQQKTTAPEVVDRKGSASRSWLRVLPWVLAGLFLITTVVACLERPVTKTSPAWPLSVLFGPDHQPVQIVVADTNYGMMRLVDQRSLSLAQYLSPLYRSGEDPFMQQPTDREARTMKYLSDALLTSYADLSVTVSLLRMSGSSSNLLNIRSARELNPRALEEGNFVFIGSPSSNPWVSYFDSKLNFQERDGAIVGEGPKYFLNLHPKPGEQQKYQGLAITGSSGEDYATISLLPLPAGNGNVLIFQGLQQEGTEAAGRFLADPDNRKKLEHALGITNSTREPVYFEVLIRNQTVAGAPNATSIVATRIIHP